MAISLLLFSVLVAGDLLFLAAPRNGWFLRASWPGYFGLLTVLFGVGIRSWAAGTLRKGVDLTTIGPYSLCRNPLYLGSFFVMLGFCILIGFVHDFVVVCGLIRPLYVLTIRGEESRLEEQYADRWCRYSSRTPRFLPYRPTSHLPGEWSLQQWLKSREYQGLLGSLLGLAALEAWRLSR